MYICMHVSVCVCVHMYVGMYVYMWCKLNHNRKHILCVSYTVVIMYAALIIFGAVCVIYIIYCLSWGFYGCDKTPRPKSICTTKINLQRKGFILSSSLELIIQGSQGTNREGETDAEATVTCWLAFHGLFSLLSYDTRKSSPGVAPAQQAEPSDVNHQ